MVFKVFSHERNYLEAASIVQYNLDYPESSGPGKNVRLIESSDNRVCTRKLTCYYMYV